MKQFQFSNQMKRSTAEDSLVLEDLVVDGDDYATTFLFTNDGLPEQTL